MPSMRAASSPRSRTGRASRSSGRGEAAIERDRAHPRVVAGHDVRLIRDDERQSLVRRDPGEERHQRPRRRVRAVQVLEHEDDRFPLAEPAQHAEDAFERPGLATFRGALVARQRRPPGRLQTSRHAGHDPDDVGRGRTEHGVQSSSDRASSVGPTDRTTGPYGSSVPAGIAAPRSTVIGSRESADPSDRLVEEAADPDAGRSAQEHRAGPSAGGIVEHGRESREGVLAPDEPRARVPAGHAHSRPEVEPDDPGRGASRRGGPEPRLGWATMTDGRAAPHPDNTLNELSGEEWLYFTKSVLTTAYPSELGHAARKAHGANKPPRLMARLIEFFTRTGELVLDPFAGVGGTLLGAAIARGPRRAIGIELEPRWVAIYETVVRDLAAERDGAGPLIADLGATDPGGPRGFDPSGCELRLGDALAILPDAARGLRRLRRHGPALQRASCR